MLMLNIEYDYLYQIFVQTLIANCHKPHFGPLKISRPNPSVSQHRLILNIGKAAYKPLSAAGSCLEIPFLLKLVEVNLRKDYGAYHLTYEYTETIENFMNSSEIIYKL